MVLVRLTLFNQKRLKWALRIKPRTVVGSIFITLPSIQHLLKSVALATLPILLNCMDYSLKKLGLFQLVIFGVCLLVRTIVGHTLNWVFCQGGCYRAFSGGCWLFFFFDEVKMKHFVFFRRGAPGSFKDTFWVSGG